MFISNWILRIYWWISFRFIPSNPRLMYVFFNSTSNLDHESYWYSFASDITCDCYAILRLRKYLWGVLFNWICDCNTIKEILEYNGSIHRLKRWSQETLVYKVIVIHRISIIMKDVDDLSCYVDPLIYQYIITVFRLHTKDVTKRPFAYTFDFYLLR